MSIIEGDGLLYVIDSLGKTLAAAEERINHLTTENQALKAAHRRGSDDEQPDESPVEQHDGSTLPPDEEEPTP